MRQAKEAGGSKVLNENLTPLRRYLERQVGRPWNKVYSEIAVGLKVTSTAGSPNLPWAVQTPRTGTSRLARLNLGDIGYGRASL